MDLWCLNGNQQSRAGCDSAKWEFSWAVLSCSVPVGKNNAMWQGGLAGLFWLDEIWFDLLADVVFCQDNPTRRNTHARSGPLFEPSRQRCVCVRVSSALAVTSPFQVTGNMAPVWHTHRGRKHHTQPSTWLHTISAAMTHNLYMSSLYCSPFLPRQPTKNMRQPWMMPECPARRERWGITRAISSSKFN